MTSSTASIYPVQLYRCLACGHEHLAAAPDRIYCPRCGQLYPLLSSRAVDFLGGLRPGEDGIKTPAQAITHLPGFGWGYDQLWRPWALSVLTGESFSAEREAQLLQDLVGESSPVLDLGTASGYWSRLLLTADPDRMVLGLDLAPGLLEEAARRSRPQWSHYSLIRASAEQLPLASGSLGAVISGAALNEIPLDPTLREIGRVLRPGGYLVTLHSQKESGWEWIQQILQKVGLRFPDRSELRLALAGAGLRVDRYLSFGPLAWVRAVRQGD